MDSTTFWTANGSSYGNGKKDLAVANRFSDNVNILLGNGTKDLAVVNSKSNTVTILRNLGDGTFKTPIHLDTGASPESVVAADFNQDGRLDLLLNAFFEDEVRVLLQV